MSGPSYILKGHSHPVRTTVIPSLMTTARGHDRLVSGRFEGYHSQSVSEYQAPSSSLSILVLRQTNPTKPSLRSPFIASPINPTLYSTPQPFIVHLLILTSRVWCTNIKSSWERRWTSPTQPQCQLRGSQVHFASQARFSVLGYPLLTLGWNCTWCTMQPSPPRKLGGLGCIVHLVQFQLKYTWGQVEVLLSSQARRGVLQPGLRCTWARVGAANTGATIIIFII